MQIRASVASIPRLGVNSFASSIAEQISAEQIRGQSVAAQRCGDFRSPSVDGATIASSVLHGSRNCAERPYRKNARKDVRFGPARI